MLIDTVKALFAIIVFTAMWWLMTPYLSSVWGALHPLVENMANSGNAIAKQGISTLDILKAMWNAIPIIVDGAILVWLYLRAQRVEPDSYYMPPPQ